MLEVDGVFALVLLGLWIYCIFDVISTDDSMVRNLPKMLWLLIVFFIPDIGSIAWLILGRPQGTSFEPGSAKYRAPRRSTSPDDDPEFLAGLRTTAGPGSVHETEEQVAERRRLAEWNEELKRREADIRRREMLEQWAKDNPADPENP
jgi:hypothetical protein